MKAWQARPLEEIYPIIYLDALVVKVRDGHQVRNKAAHIAVGVDLDGVKHVLGIWVQATEGAKFWAGVCAELRNRGVRDVLIVCCDGLTGFPEAVEATWPQTTVQTCTVHLIRAAMRFVSYQRPQEGRRRAEARSTPHPPSRPPRPNCSPSPQSDLGRKYPAAVATWQNAWDRFIPFLAFPPELRKIIYTTNAIESLNYQLRKIIKNRGTSRPTTPRSSCSGSRSATSKTNAPAQRAKEKGLPANQRKAPPRLVEGAVVQGWQASPRRPRPGLPRPPRPLPHLNKS